MLFDFGFVIVIVVMLFVWWFIECLVFGMCMWVVGENLYVVRVVGISV